MLLSGNYISLFIVLIVAISLILYIGYRGTEQRLGRKAARDILYRILLVLLGVTLAFVAGLCSNLFTKYSWVKYGLPSVVIIIVVGVFAWLIKLAFQKATSWGFAT